MMSVSFHNIANVKSPILYLVFIIAACKYCNSEEYTSENVYYNTEETTDSYEYEYEYDKPYDELVEIGSPETRSMIKNAEISAAKYIVSVIASTETTRNHLATGIYIHELWVVTVSQYLSFPDEQYEVAMGSDNALSGDTRKVARSRKYEVAKDEIHIQCDIALLMLDKPFNLNSKIGMLHVADAVVFGSSCKIVGWGVDISPKPTLQTVNAKIIETNTCREAFKNSVFKKDIDSPIVCAQVDTSLCYADQGSALICANALVGVLSFSAECGSHNPHIFTNIPYYESWMFSYINRTSVLYRATLRHIYCIVFSYIVFYL